MRGKDNETRVCWDDCSDMHVKEEDGEKKLVKDNTGGLSVGIVIVIAVGVVLASIIIATVAALMYRRYWKKDSESETATPTIEELRRRLDDLKSSTMSNGTAAS